MMIRLFSSDFATAFANLVVFIGLSWGAFKLIGPRLKKLSQRLSSRSRKARQKEIIQELLELRELRDNFHILMYRVVDRVARTAMLWMLSFGISALIFVFIISPISPVFEYLSDNDNKDADAMMVIIIATFFILALAVYEIRREIEAIKRVGYYTSSREELLREYIQLRGLR